MCLRVCVDAGLQNACEHNKGGCDQLCDTDEKGQVQCGCYEGLKLAENGTYCQRKSLPFLVKTKQMFIIFQNVQNGVVMWPFFLHMLAHTSSESDKY